MAGTGFHTGHMRLMKSESGSRQGFEKTEVLMNVKSESGRSEEVRKINVIFLGGDAVLGSRGIAS